MSNGSNLTARRELFLEYLFNDAECNGNTVLAARKAGYTDQDHSRIVRELKDEILTRSQEQLALKAPKAVRQLVEMMDEDGTIPKAEIRLKAVENVLDRVGVAKKQQIDVSGGDSSPLFFISSKAASVLTDNNDGA